jgi:putative addiction module killer protein
VLRVVEYLDARGRSPYARWFISLNDAAAAKVAEALYRLLQGNFSNVRGVGAGVFERKVSFGPGYRIYFGQDGPAFVVLLGGSTKQDQSEAIKAAIACWADYKRRRP